MRIVTFYDTDIFGKARNIIAIFIRSIAAHAATLFFHSSGKGSVPGNFVLTNRFAAATMN